MGRDGLGMWDATHAVSHKASCTSFPSSRISTSQRSFQKWLASISLALRERERERGGTWCTWLLHTNELVPSTTAAQTDDKTRLTYSFGNSPSTKQHKRLICWHTTTGSGDPSFQLGMHKSGLGSPVAWRGRQHVVCKCGGHARNSGGGGTWTWT